MNYYVTYDNYLKFSGFFDNIQSLPNNLKYIKISKSLKDTLISVLSYSKDVTFKTGLDNNLIYDDINDICIIKYDDFNLEQIKNALIKRIKETCEEFITSGLLINIGTEIKDFSFKIEDQINLKELVDNYSNSDYVYYHANNEYNTLYSYKDIVKIYKELYNNKLYNQIYTQTLCKWIIDNYTKEMYEDKEFIISYGYSNNFILKEVEECYEQYKLL